MATINGTNGNNTLVGGAEDDVIVARGGADNLSGGDGNDVIIIDVAPAGSDTVDGGAGIDIVVLDADYADFAISEGSGTLVLTGLDATTETLSNVEQVVFNDQTVYIVGAGGYPTIQAAVDAAGPGGIILVTAGTYVEQVDINGKTNLTITAVPGADVTIQAPADVTQTSTSSSGRANNAVVTVENSTNIVIANITVDGAGAGNSVDGGNAQFLGVSYRNASGGLENVDVTGVRDAYPGGTTVGGEPIQSGNQRGVGVSVDNDAPGMGNPLLGFFMEGGSISDFQKNATVFNRADLTINGVTITGGGAQPVNAQNGIQVANSTGTISNNIITEIGYAGPQTVYSGMILAFGNTGLDITGNTITGTNGDTLDAQTVGIYVLDFGPDNSGGSITGNTISFVDSAIDVSGDLGPDSILISGNIITDIDVTDPFAGGVSFAPNGSTNDTVSGSDAVDFLFGGAGTDTLSGLGGNDQLDGGTGSDTLNGGMGIDTAIYAGSVADYSYVIAYDPSGFATGFSSVTNTASGDVDTLTSVEILQFGDATLDLGAPVQLLDADGDLIGTFTTIQGAVDAAGSVVGAVTVLVNDGNYTESVIIDRSDLTLRSVNGRDATTITGVQGAALGSIEIDPGVNNVTIGGTGAGFTIIGLNGDGGIENAAIYLQGAHDNIDVIGNDVVANGDAGLLGEFGQNNSNFLVDGNIFSGQTFDGANPSGTGFGQQFDIGNNVPRQLVTLGSGNNGAVGTNIVFTNNEVTGTAGGISTTTGNPLGNSLVTIDVPGSTISGNVFSGNTTGAGYALRARSQDVDIANNSLTGDSGGIFVNNGGVPGTYGGNSFTGTAGADAVFAMTDGDDTVTTLGGNDQIGTNGGNDTIDAGDGDDQILAGAGSDSIDGGDGNDTAGFASLLSGSDLAVVSDADGKVTGFTSVVTGLDTDTLTSIEVLQFIDVALDLADPIQLFDADGDLVGTFDSIQDAIDAAGNGASIKISAGIYTEQLTIDGKTGLSISAFGDDVVEIVAPADLAVNGVSVYYGDNVRAVIAVTASTDVTISGVTVDGAFAGDTSPGSNGDELSGIAFLDSTGGIDGVTIENVGNSTSGGLFGLQHGSGLFIDNTGPGDDDVSVTNSTITGFQKTGALIVGADIVFTGNTITGVGATNLTAQNGIQLAQSQGTVSNNNISGIGYTVPDGGTYFYSAGIIAYEPTGALAMDGNTITGVGTAGEFTALDLSDTQGIEVSFQNNVIADATNGIFAYSFFGGTFGLDANPDFTGTTFANISGLGISFDPEETYGAPFTTATAFSVTGTQFDDVLAGSDGDDSFTGGDGADEFTGRGGSDTLNGGDGSDTANYEGDAADYSFTADVDGDGFVTGFTSVTDTATGDVDTLSSIETLEFGDGAVFSIDDDVQLFDALGAFVGSFATIQEAVDAASDDYVIRVREGSYDEDVTVDVGVTIIGAQNGIAGSDEARDGAAGTGETTVIGRWTITSTTDVTIDGLRFVNDATTTGGGASNPTLGIRTGGDSAGHSVTNSIFWSTVAGGANGVDDRAISTSVIGSGAISITDNLISGTSTGAFSTAAWGRGIWFDGGGVALTVDGNTTQSTRTAVNLDMTGMSTAAITDNAVTNAGTFISGGVDVDGVTVSGNDINNVGTDFNFRNLTSDVTFDASGAIGTVTPVDPANPGVDAITILGGGGNDSFIGTDGADVLDGNNFNLTAGDNDTLTGGLGNDLLLGRGGNDTAGYSETVTVADITAVVDANPLVAGDQAGWTVTTAGGTDNLVDIEAIGHAGGRILLVGNGGYETIQAAVDAANDGDTILIAAGNYAEDVIVDVGVTIYGAQYGDAGSDAGRDAATGVGETNITGNWRITSATDVTIDGLRFVNDATTTGGAGNVLLGVLTGGDDTGHVITNSIFWSTISGAANDDRAIQVSPVASGAVSITDNLISGSSQGLFGTASWGRGIWSDGGGVTVSIDGNTTSWTRTAINLDNSGGSLTTVSNNSITNAGSGVSVGVSADGITFTDNDLTNVGSDFNFRNLTTDVTFDASTAVDTVTPVDPANPGQDTVVILGGTGNDTLTGTDGADLIDGNNSANQAASDTDSLTGGLGNDLLYGRNGNDTANYSETVTTADIAAVVDADPLAAGNQAGWTVTTAGGTDTLVDVEIVSHAGGTIRLVGNGGYATIQEAVDASVDGDTILVAAGSYAEDVVVDVGVTIVGANGGESGSDVGRDAANGVGETTVIGNWRITSAADVTIDGLRFVNDATTTGGPGNVLLGVLTGGHNEGHSITNSIFWSTISGAANDDRAIQVSPIAAGSVSITDNLISGTQQSMFGSASWGRAVWFDGGGVALTVDGNTISWARTGVNLDMSGTSTATVSNNDLTNSGTGVSVGVDNDGVTLLDNDISNVGTDFNFRNLTSNVVFDAEAAVATLTPGFAANDTVVILTGSGNDTVTGTSGADFIDGNNNPGLLTAVDTDTLSGLAGNDAIFGRFGNDVLNGGADNDTLDGGDGVDSLFGEDGTDTLTGGEGNDFLDGGTGADAMTGGNGDDVFIVDDFGDTTSGGAGRDTVRTSTASWTLAADIEVLSANSANALTGTGNALDNTISGSISGDTLSGLDGIDTIFGRAGNDTILGGDGNDLLYGQENDDTLIGGNGNDYLEGGAGLDIMIGGTGDDVYLASDFGDLVAEQSGEGIDTVRAVNANYTLSANIENLQYFGAGNFIGYGNAENNQVIGGNGNDFLYGIAGNDRLIGGSGNDYLDGGIGADTMNGGLGNDSYIVDDIGDAIGEAVDQGTDTVQTTLASYTLTANVENLNYIGTGNFTGNGSAVANTIFTQGGNDIVNGLAGNDVISTRAGTDVLNGGAGRDVLTGGADADRFVFAATGDTAVGQADRITDFSTAQGDKIDVSLIDAITGGANNAFTFIGGGAFTSTAGQLRAFTSAGNTFVEGDVNGDGVADFSIQVDGIVPLSGTDFIL